LIEGSIREAVRAWPAVLVRAPVLGSAAAMRDALGTDVDRMAGWGAAGLAAGFAAGLRSGTAGGAMVMVGPVLGAFLAEEGPTRGLAAALEGPAAHDFRRGFPSASCYGDTGIQIGNRMLSFGP
jgi:hypothetical protein